MLRAGAAHSTEEEAITQATLHTSARRTGRLSAAGRAALLAATLAAAVVVAAPYWLAAIGHWLAMPGEPEPADVIAVHGGNRARTRYAVELYQQGLAPRLWHTGYAETTDEVTNEVIAAGVPADSVAYLSSVSTWTDAGAIVAAARDSGARRVLVVTDWWHSRRAFCADQQRLDDPQVTLVFAASPAPAGPDSWWQHERTRGHVLSELAKIGYYGLRYGLVPWGC